MLAASKPDASGQTKFDKLYNEMRTYPPPLLLPSNPYNKSKSHEISDLFVHPTLEAALHLLNHDLPSAHFLLRHMQAAPMYEGMYLHGILHRIEGDYDNARAWYSDVAESDIFTAAWSIEQGLQRAKDFIQRIQDFKRNPADGAFRKNLERESLQEIEKAVEFCKRKFGTDKWDDVSSEWVQPSEGKVKDMKQDMLTGEKGFRNF